MSDDLKQVQFYDDDSTLLICPNCGGSNIHHLETTVYERDEDANTGLKISVKFKEANISTSLDGNPSLRRDGITISFNCENCEAQPLLSLMQHKGGTYLSWSNTIGQLK